MTTDSISNYDFLYMSDSIKNFKKFDVWNGWLKTWDVGGSVAAIGLTIHHWKL